MSEINRLAVHLATQKGQIRNTVLNQVKILRDVRDKLVESRDVKSKEIDEYKNKNSEKSSQLKKQVSIMDAGVKHIEEAVKTLDKYKHVTVT